MTKSRNINRKAWKPTDVELASFRALYPSTTSKALAERFGVAVTQVCSLAHRLGLKKSAEFLASPASGRLDGVRGSESRFQKGGESWNKGRTVNAIGKTLVESAMVEVEFIKATGVDGTGFIGADGEDEDSTEKHLRLASSKNPAAHNPFPTSARHRLEG